MNNVFNLGGDGVTKLDLNATVTMQNILRDVELEGFVIAGYTKDGQEFFSSTYASGPEALWLLERCKKMLMEVVDDECT